MWRKRLLAIVLVLGWAGQVFAGGGLSGSVKKIIDGDSLLVATARGDLEIRLYGVDCPEYDQPFAGKAKAFAKNAVLGKKVVIEPVDVDKYGRTVAIVGRGQDILNRDLVQAGLAWVYPRYCRKAFCDSWKAEERAARNKRIGLWQETHPNPPWQWKHRKTGR